MKPKRLIALTVAILAIAMIYIFFVKKPPTAYGTLTLAMSNGVCVKTLVGNNGGSSMKAKRNAKVQWDVVNNCTTDATVSVQDFVPQSGPADTPILSGTDHCSATKNGGTCSIELKIKSDARIVTYVYAVWINGTKADPDLMIET